jgi:uncharacterized membrane protein
MQRRSFLGAMLAAAAAPAIVRSESLMKLVPTKSGILTYELNPDSLEQMMINIRENIDLQPKQLIVPAYTLNLARSMLHTKETVSAGILLNSFRMG